MLFDALLLIALMATIVLGIKLQLDLNKLPKHKEEFKLLIQKSAHQLDEMEKLADKIKHINYSDKESLHRLNVRAKAHTEEIKYTLQKCEEMLKELKSVKAIDVYKLLENTPTKPKPTEQPENAEIKVKIKKDQLLKQVNNLR